MLRIFLYCSVLAFCSPVFAAEEPSSQAVDLNQQIVPLTGLPGGPTQLTPPSAELPPAEWNAEDWEVQKPQLNLLELDGYFRVRPDMLINPSLGNNAPGLAFSKRIETTAAGTTAAARDSTVAGANMRLRIQPTLNITEDIQLVAQFDILDNLVLGSTPSTVNSTGNVLNILEVGQLSPQAGLNALRDAIQVRRVYAKVATPIGELRFGRQPNQWGLGMYANAGDCIDCDHTSNVDRISFVGMLGSYYIVPMIDFMAEGPTSITAAQPYGYARDLDQLDDATQLSLQVAKRDSPEDIKEMVERGQVVFNWGLWNMFRFQGRENPRYYMNPTVAFDASNPSTVITRQARDAFAYIVDGWFKLQFRKLTIEAEALFLYSQFRAPNDGAFNTPGSTAVADTLLFKNFARQWGGALDARYDILPELYVRLRTGVASGDNAQGFGLGPHAYNNLSVADHTIDNFQFARDYRVDLILFRELIGTVSGAWYIKPEVAYTFANGLGGRFAPMYAQALYPSSTPSGTGGAAGSAPLGFELDFEAFFQPLKKRGFEASLQYGLFLPLDMGLRNPDTRAVTQTPGIAHRIIGRMAVVF